MKGSNIHQIKLPVCKVDINNYKRLKHAITSINKVILLMERDDMPSVDTFFFTYKLSLNGIKGVNYKTNNKYKAVEIELRQLFETYISLHSSYISKFYNELIKLIHTQESVPYTNLTDELKLIFPRDIVDVLIEYYLDNKVLIRESIDGFFVVRLP